nr:FeoB-associated Cys-rich membrane protein [Winogradskyella sp.]
MNTVIQNILVFAALGLALVFLYRKFFWKPKRATTSDPDNYRGCGNNGCGCH